MRPSLAVLVALTALAAAVPATASQGGGVAVRPQLASGRGVAADGSKFSCNARLLRNSSGKMTYVDPVYGFKYTATVSCLKIIPGEQALLAGVITSVDPASGATPGTTMYFVVSDGGKRAADGFEAWFGGTEDPCEASPFVFPPPPPIQSGQITIR